MNKNACPGLNPRTGVAIKIAAAKTVKFTAGKALRTRSISVQAQASVTADSEQLTFERQQIHHLHGCEPFAPIGIDRPDHDVLTASLTQDLDDALSIAGVCPAGQFSLRTTAASR
jgi:hypothetical protein